MRYGLRTRSGRGIQLGEPDWGRAELQPVGACPSRADASVPGEDDGNEPGANDAADRAYFQREEVKPKAYRWCPFATWYRRIDIALLRVVHEAHEDAQRAATQKILQREFYDFAFPDVSKKHLPNRAR